MTRVLCALAGVALATSVASAQWSDNFDSYASNVNINGQGGWQGWGGTAAAAPVTSTAQFISGPNSINVSVANGSDNVHLYTGVTTGWWEYTANVYVPTAFTGDSYFILLNQYSNAGPWNWSIEYQLNGTTNTFSDDYTNGTATVSGPGNSRTGSNLALIRNAWTQIRVDFNPATNQMITFYNGAVVSSGSWKTSATSLADLAAVDLFANAGTGGVYYDNLSLAQIPSPASFALLGLGGLVASRRRRA